MYAFDLANISWNAILNYKLQMSFDVLRGELVLLSTSTLINICQRESSVTEDGIKK
jgi:hypothetical protein